MELRKMGNTDMEVSVLGFGGAEIGFESANVETVRQLLNDAFDAGLNVVDTAECYMNSEELIGEAVSDRRKDFYLFTKVGHLGPERQEDWTKPGILASIERSLKNLRTDRLDLVQLHSCSLDELKKGEAVEALNAAREKGYTRYIGYSGDDQAALYAVESGAFDTLQTSVNIADQQAIDLTLPLARDKKMGVIAKRPIANAAWKTGMPPESDYHRTYYERLQKLQYDFVTQDLASSVATAMRFTASVPGVHTMIVGTKKPGRWRENAAMLTTALSASDFNTIRSRWNDIAEGDWIGQI